MTTKYLIKVAFYKSIDLSLWVILAVAFFTNIVGFQQYQHSNLNQSVVKPTCFHMLIAVVGVLIYNPGTKTMPLFCA